MSDILECTPANPQAYFSNAIQSANLTPWDLPSEGTLQLIPGEIHYSPVVDGFKLTALSVTRQDSTAAVEAVWSQNKSDWHYRLAVETAPSHLHHQNGTTAYQSHSTITEGGHFLTENGHGRTSTALQAFLGPIAAQMLADVTEMPVLYSADILTNSVNGSLVPSPHTSCQIYTPRFPSN